MAIVSDLRKILGNTFDFGTNDDIAGTTVNDTMSMHGGNDRVFGFAGADLIFDNRALNGGSSGYDIVRAGAGDDIVVSSLDTGNEFHGDAGIDTFIANASNGASIDLALGWAKDRSINVETFLGGFENATGSVLNDYVSGNAQANRLHGNNGDDLLRGRDGNDTLFGGNGQDVLFGGNQNDYVNGNAGNDILYGEAGNDQLFGELGTDTLVGGIGKDYLVGGANADTFKFTSLADSGVTGATADMIADFVHLLDKINVADIDARATQAGNQAFTFIGNNNFTAAGQIRYVLDATSQDTVILLNTDNDSAAEMIIKIDPLVALSAGDFVL